MKLSDKAWVSIRGLTNLMKYVNCGCIGVKPTLERFVRQWIHQACETIKEQRKRIDELERLTVVEINDDTEVHTQMKQCPRCGTNIEYMIVVNGSGKNPRGYVYVPFSWLVKFCTHIDFKEPMSDEEREKLWREKLFQQFGINVDRKDDRHGNDD